MYARAAQSVCKAAAPTASALKAAPLTRDFATVASTPLSSVARKHKVVVVGAGSAGTSISHQLLRKGNFAREDIAVVDPAEWHHYQPGWTLVGAGVKAKEDLRRPMKDLMDAKLKFYNQGVGALTPKENTVTLGDGTRLEYEHLVLVPGIKINYDSIKGLPEALADPDRHVSTTYGYDTCNGVFSAIQNLKKGQAIFTQPSGVIKCAGAPQKIMWLALDYWKKRGLYGASNTDGSPVRIAFATGLPVMFGIPKYSDKLEQLRMERGVEGLFEHDLIAIDGDKATFARPGGKDTVSRRFDFLHAVPKMGPHDFVKNSEVANEGGYVDVDQTNMRSTKLPNVWSVGDASSLPTSKTAAAITAQAPVVVGNLLRAMEHKAPDRAYDGYTSCPLTTEYGKVLLAEFKYGGEPKETFGRMVGIDQAEPRRVFWYMKKDFFPWVYNRFMVKGMWHGPKGWSSS